MDAIERKISKLENKVKELNHKLEDQEIAEDPAKLAEICDKVGILEIEIAQLYLTWEELS